MGNLQIIELNRNNKISSITWQHNNLPSLLNIPTNDEIKKIENSNEIIMTNHSNLIAASVVVYKPEDLDLPKTKRKREFDLNGKACIILTKLCINVAISSEYSDNFHQLDLSNSNSLEMIDREKFEVKTVLGSTFWSGKAMNLICRIDNKGEAIACALSSSQPFHTQIIINLNMTGFCKHKIAIVCKPYKLLSLNDNILEDENGNLNLIIEDLRWNSSSSNIIILFSNGAIIILSREGAFQKIIQDESPQKAQISQYYLKLPLSLNSYYSLMITQVL